MRSVRRSTALCSAGIAALAACGEPLGLPRAVFPNVVDTVSLYALHGTHVALPSGFFIQDARAVRIDQVQTFDFAFDIDTAGRALLLTTGPLGMGQLSGGQTVQEAFDSILIAPPRDYDRDSALIVDVGTVAVMESRLVTCTFGIPAFFYAKLKVLTVDTTSGPDGRRIDLQILANRNCGYRGLEPGLPVR